jgi:hypothetical protein
VNFESPEEAMRAAGGRTERFTPAGAVPTESDKCCIEAVTLPPVGAAKIPPRPWAYGSYLQFGSAAVLGAVDGGGKGAIAVGKALAMITGKKVLGERVWRTGPVVIVTYEDDETEWHRRIAAACIHHCLDYKHVMENIRFLRKPGGHVSFGMVQEGRVIFPDSKHIIDQLSAIKAALLIIDPFNHAHNLDDGNNNVMVAKVAAEMSRIALESNTAVLVLHHLRKGSSGHPDDLMGATSLRATFRSARILSRMTTDEAAKMKIAEPWRYIRIAGSKENYAPPPEKATWFKLISVPLGNGDDDYPKGDDVAVATTWQPRAAFAGMNATTLSAVFATLRESIHTPNKQAKHTPWAGIVLVEVGGRNEDEASKIIRAWLESGVLVKTTYYHGASKNQVEKVTVNDVKASEILAEIEGMDAPPR